jgi:hypothetical protein
MAVLRPVCRHVEDVELKNACFELISAVRALKERAITSVQTTVIRTGPLAFVAVWR